MRDFLLRLGQATAARWHHLQREEDGRCRLTITVSKANPGNVAYVSARTMDALDGMRGIKEAMGMDTTDGRIFQMGSQQLRRHVRNACSFAGLVGRYGWKLARDQHGV